MALISYTDLKEKVWDAGKCCGCGACVGLPYRSAPFDSNEATSPTSNDYCKVTRDSVPCGACFSACPRTELVETSGLGTVIPLYQSKSNLNMPYAQAGGVATSLLLAARKSDLIDGVILMDVDRWNQQSEPKLAVTSDEILAAAGSRYVWAPILKELREAIEERKLKKIAVVGTPCVMTAVRKIRDSDLDVLFIYKNAIRLSLGLFCTEIFTHKLLDKLEKELDVNLFDVKSVDVKGKLIVTLHNSGKVEIPLKDISDVKKRDVSAALISRMKMQIFRLEPSVPNLASQ